MAKMGRPTVGRGEPSANVQLRLPASLYDQAYAVAARERVSLTELIRRAIRREVDATESSTPAASSLS
jgi:predicted HicB family RNase H-like nuclease